MSSVYFITHPDVLIDPAVPVPDWSLSPRGRDRMRRVLKQPWAGGIRAIHCSTERKAIDGAAILADGLGLGYAAREPLGENDRSTTGYLPSAEFEAMADAFFARPEESVRGWERAVDAQRRIIAAMSAIRGTVANGGDVAVVSHGGVGTLYLCHLKDCSISRQEDQPRTNGGNYYAFDSITGRLHHGWRSIDSRARQEHGLRLGFGDANAPAG